MIQFQGSSIKGKSRTSGEGCKEINIRSEQPIKAVVVKSALSLEYSKLSEKEQKALSDSYNKTNDFIDKAALNGGISSTYKSIKSKTGKSGDRCDIKIDGTINLIP